MELIITNRKGDKFTVLYDDEFIGIVKTMNWHVTKNKNGYARTHKSLGGGVFKSILMHKLFIKCPYEGLLIDHINGNTLDNRLCNLRMCTPQQNSANRKPFGKSKYLGVCVSTNRAKWQAQININGKYKHLGRFTIEEDAARAYDAAAKIHYKEFANLNFKDDY
jgi:hypothetical protein